MLRFVGDGEKKKFTKSLPFFNAKFPGKHEKNIHKILLESRQRVTIVASVLSSIGIGLFKSFPTWGFSSLQELVGQAFSILVKFFCSRLDQIIRDKFPHRGFCASGTRI